MTILLTKLRAGSLSVNSLLVSIGLDLFGNLPLVRRPRWYWAGLV